MNMSYLTLLYLIRHLMLKLILPLVIKLNPFLVTLKQQLMQQQKPKVQAAKIGISMTTYYMLAAKLAKAFDIHCQCTVAYGYSSQTLSNALQAGEHPTYKAIQFLPTIQHHFPVRDQPGRKIRINILYNLGAETSIIEKSVVTKLRLEQHNHGHAIDLYRVGGGITTTSTTAILLLLDGHTTKCWVVAVINSLLAPVPVSIQQQWTYLHTHQMSTAFPHGPIKLEILICIDNASSFHETKHINGNDVVEIVTNNSLGISCIKTKYGVMVWGNLSVPVEPNMCPYHNYANCTICHYSPSV